MPLPMQVKLLRVLQNRTIERLGGTRTVPVNVRELENACERIAQTCSCGTVRVACVSASILFRAGAQPAEQPAQIATTSQPAPISLDARLREVEANLIGWALKVSGGNKFRAAELLQIRRSTLGDRINRCGLGRTQTRRAPSDVSAPTSPVNS